MVFLHHTCKRSLTKLLWPVLWKLVMVKWGWTRVSLEFFPDFLLLKSRCLSLFFVCLAIVDIAACASPLSSSFAMAADRSVICIISFEVDISPCCIKVLALKKKSLREMFFIKDRNTNKQHDNFSLLLFEEIWSQTTCSSHETTFWAAFYVLHLFFTTLW